MFPGMSVVPTALLADERLCREDIQMYAAMARQADRNGECWGHPKSFGIDRPLTAIGNLRASGWLEQTSSMDMQGFRLMCETPLRGPEAKGKRRAA